jgi:hypothetical protein
MDGFPKRQLKQYRERNEAKAKELKELAFERVKQCDTKGAVKLFQVSFQLCSIRVSRIGSLVECNRAEQLWLAFL